MVSYIEEEGGKIFLTLEDLFNAWNKVNKKIEKSNPHQTISQIQDKYNALKRTLRSTKDNDSAVLIMHKCYSAIEYLSTDRITEINCNKIGVCICESKNPFYSCLTKKKINPTEKRDSYDVVKYLSF
jgi:hypothetical protein